MKDDKVKAALAAFLSLSCMATAVAAEGVVIDPVKVVSANDTTIDAIIAVQEAVTAAQRQDAAAQVSVLPLPAGTPRNDAFNREMPWLADGKTVVWKGPKRTGGDSEDGSHLNRRENRDGVSYPWWYARMKEKRDEIRASGGSYDIVMLGDSITHWWERDEGKSVLPDLKRTYSMLNLGYGGDKADTLLWRLRNGELDGYRASLFTLMIGTNNHMEGRDTPERTAHTIGEILATLRAKQPQAKVLLMAVFPRTSPEQGRMRARNLAVTRLIRPMADEKTVFWRDYRGLFLHENGAGRFNLLADGTHPSPTGLRVWRDAMLPDFARFTGKRHEPAETLRMPCARRWFAARADASDENACRRLGALVTHAHAMGYNGVCLDVFGRQTAAWTQDEKKRLFVVRDLCRDAGMQLVPVLRPLSPDADESLLKWLKDDFAPSAVFIATNGAPDVAREPLRLATIRRIEQVAKVLPDAEVILWARPFVGYSAGIPADVTAASEADFAYFRKRKSRAMMIVDADGVNCRNWNLHVPIRNFICHYRAKGEREGILYWTVADDYRMLQDVVDLGQHQE